MSSLDRSLLRPTGHITIVILCPDWHQNNQLTGTSKIFILSAGGWGQSLTFFKLGFTTYKVKQPLQAMELQEKEAQND